MSIKVFLLLTLLLPNHEVSATESLRLNKEIEVSNKDTSSKLFSKLYKTSPRKALTSKLPIHLKTFMSKFDAQGATNELTRIAKHVQPLIDQISNVNHDSTIGEIFDQYETLLYGIKDDFKDFINGETNKNDFAERLITVIYFYRNLDDVINKEINYMAELDEVQFQKVSLTKLREHEKLLVTYVKENIKISKSLQSYMDEAGMEL
ncbi:MAG: hypothetical protein KC646_16135 [Candidatus Cloacimonetes bacterium]|nr:hypothetical protein [Candidatus Cloacimonadota bacterium]